MERRDLPIDPGKDPSRGRPNPLLAGNGRRPRAKNIRMDTPGPETLASTVVDGIATVHKRNIMTTCDQLVRVSTTDDALMGDKVEELEVVESLARAQPRSNDAATSLPSRRTKKTKLNPDMVDSVCKPCTDVNETKKKKQQKEDVDDMNWVCAECKEAECLMEPSAEQFLLCDGLCHRVFHYPCAGLSQVPDSDEDWICKDCTRQSHQCAFCQEYGKDNVDVFACRKAKCGLFFHESCLALNNVEVKYEPRNESQPGALPSPRSVEADPDLSENLASTVPSFTCPAHTCWTCTQKDALLQEKLRDEAAKAALKKAGKKVKKSKKKKQSIYQCKTENRLYRCLYCPWAYHVTCIPPTSRFHELAILCPEHSKTHKLPDLDMSTSFQNTLENKIDRAMFKISGSRKAKRKFGGANPFFPGLRGDRMISSEVLYMDHVAKLRDSNQIKKDRSAIEENGSDLPFCLPQDIKTEVHSKPPNYTHLNGLRYNSEKRPKRIPSSGEQCQCIGKCGEDCFNRLSLIECSGEGPNSNCNVGDKCGNRSMGKRQFVKCKPKREPGKGWGLVSLVDIPMGNLVLEYVGEVVDEKEKEERLVSWNADHPNDPNFYVMGLGSGWYVDAREFANMSRFINHSCDPNCQVMTINVRGYHRNGVYTKRDIKAGEFLSYDYHFDTKQADRFICRCGGKNCRGTMRGGGSGAEAKKPLSWKEAKVRYDNDCKLLADLQDQRVKSDVGALLPAAEQPTEYVYSGPPEKYRTTALHDRIFLWRNTTRGSDFLARSSRLEKSSPRKGATSKDSSGK